MSADGLAAYTFNLGGNNYGFKTMDDATKALGNLNAFGEYGNVKIDSNNQGIWDNTMDFLGSDTMKGIGSLAGIGMGIANIFNSRSAAKQAKKQWEAENARANEIMAMNREKYNTYKADKARLNAGYSGLAASGVA